MKVYQASSYDDMCKRAARLMSAQVLLRPASVLGLATGSTPIGVYDRLADEHARGEADFSSVVSFNLDEYCGLHSDDEQSYHYFMDRYFFSRVNIPADNTHVLDGCAADIKAECERYESMIESHGGIDMQLLGLGGNGHIGFNEPGEAFCERTHCVALDESTIKANSRFFKSESDVPRKAVTMGIGTIMRARSIVLIANGEAKIEVLKKALYGPITPLVPASALRLHPNVTVIWSRS